MDILSWLKAKKAGEKADNVQSQLDQAVQEGDQLAETQQARVGADGENYATLNSRLNSEHNKLDTDIKNNHQSVNAQLAQIATNVKTLGAIGNANYYDSVTKKWYEDEGFTIEASDDSVAIQNAINEAFLKGHVVFFPYANYFIGSTIVIPSNITIFSYGARIITTVINPLDEGSYSLRIFENSDMVNGNENIRLQGLIFDGNRDSATQTQGAYAPMDNLIRLTKVNHLDIHKCVFTNHTSNWGVLGGAHNPYDFTAIALVECNDVDFINNESYNHRVEGPWFQSCKNLMIDRFYSFNEAVWTSLHLWNCDNVVIDNSYIEENNDTGSTVNLSSTSNLKVLNTKFIGGAGVDISDELNPNVDTENITIKNCYIKTNAIGIYGSPSGLKTNVVVKGNYIECLHTGVRLGECEDAIIQDNRIVCTDVLSSAGVQITEGAANLTVKENKIKATKGIGISCLSDSSYTGLKIIDNDISIYPKNVESDYKNFSGVIFVIVSTRVNVIIKNVEIARNRIKSDGSFVYTVFEALPTANTFEILDNIFYPGASVPTSRGVTISGITNFKMNRNTIDDARSVANNCINVEILDNKFMYPLGTQSSYPIMITGSSGFGKISNNYSELSTYHILRGEHSFSKYIIEKNIPALYYSDVINSEFGTTVQRPPSPYISQKFFDTDLGIPINYNGTNWVDTTGAVV